MGSPTHAASTSNDNDNHNDLTHIRGIGVSRKRWLNSLGIYTIADLSQASAETIESQLKSNGRLLSHSELKEWIAQAKAQIVAPARQQAESLNDSEDSNDREKPVAINESSQLSSTPPATESETPVSTWNSIASFKVEYQTQEVNGKLEQRTVICHLETDEIGSWSDFETQLIQSWMRDRIEVTLAQPETENPVVPEITQLRVIQSHPTGQPMVADKTHSLFPSAIQADEPFALEVSMQSVGLTDANLQKPMVCNVQCIVHDVSTGSTVNLGEVTANISLTNNAIYKALLPELILSQPGIYRLKVFVTLQNALAANASAASGYFKVPMLQVI